MWFGSALFTMSRFAFPGLPLSYYLFNFIPCWFTLADLPPPPPPSTIYIYIYIYIYVCVCVYVCMYICVCIYIYMCLCVCVCVCVLPMEWNDPLPNLSSVSLNTKIKQTMNIITYIPNSTEIAPTKLHFEKNT